MHHLLKLVSRLTLATAAVAVTHAAGAQSAAATDARWQPWVGCWQPAGAAPLAFGNEAPSAPLVCVLPAGGSAVDVATVVDGKIAARERVDAGGARVASTQDGCDGWRSGRWSPDGTRVYLHSEYSCAGSARRASDGLLAISGDGELLDVERVGVNAHAAVRSLRYRPAAVPASLAGDLPTTTAGWRSTPNEARALAAAPITIDDVKEVSAAVDPSVLEAWLVERRQGFALGARELVALADAGVPARAIDVMVALSYPTRFAVNTTTGAVDPRAMVVDSAPRPTVYGTMLPDYGGGYYGGSGIYGNGYYGWNGYSPFGGYPYGAYSGYGYGLGWYPASGPVIVVRNPDGSMPGHGRVEKGRGYTRGDDAGSTSSSAPRDTRSSGASSGGTTSSGSTRSSPPPASAPSDGTSSGRTAKPRP